MNRAAFKISCTLILAWTTFLVSSPSAALAEEFQLEPGFKLFFNGKNLTGWKVKGGESLDGKTETANKRFLVKDDKLTIDGNVKGNMVIDTAAEFANDVHIKFQYLPGAGCNNDLYFRGVKFDIKKGSVKNLKEDDWNELEIIVQGSNVEVKNNGELQYTGKATSESSPLGVRAEFGSIEIRRMRSK
jgi:hypothetical protein